MSEMKVLEKKLRMAKHIIAITLVAILVVHFIIAAY